MFTGVILKRSLEHCGTEAEIIYKKNNNKKLTFDSGMYHTKQKENTSYIQNHNGFHIIFTDLQFCDTNK